MTSRRLAEAGLDRATPLVVNEWAAVFSSVERPSALADSEAEAAHGAAVFVTMEPDSVRPFVLPVAGG
jgi:hypothetical protein